MKFVNGIRIIKEIFDSYNEYEILPVDATDLILRLISDLKYERKIKASTLDHFLYCYGHLFEDNFKENFKKE